MLPLLATEELPDISIWPPRLHAFMTAKGNAAGNVKTISLYIERDITDCFAAHEDHTSPD